MTLPETPNPNLPSEPQPVSVLLFHPADGFGGAERTSANLVRWGNRHRLRFLVVTGPKVCPHLDPEIRSLSLVDLGLSNGFSGIRRALADARVLWALARRERCRVVLGMLHYGALVAVLMRFLSLFRLRAIASPRTPSVSGIDFHVGRRGLLARQWRGIVQCFCRYADRVVVASAGLKRECVSVYGANPDKVVVIPNGIDTGRFRDSPMTEPVSADRTGFRIVTFGRLAPEKDFDTLLHAFTKLRRSIAATLLIVGEGPERERLEGLAKTLGIAESVEFAGFRADPFPYVRSGDVFVHSALFEGFGNVILEAMACGVPVVATDCDFGPREIIEHAVNGMLVPVSDPDGMARVLQDLYEDPALRARLVGRGYETLGRFRIDAMVEAYEGVILELVR